MILTRSRIFHDHGFGRRNAFSQIRLKDRDKQKSDLCVHYSLKYPSLCQANYIFAFGIGIAIKEKLQPTG